MRHAPAKLCECGTTISIRARQCDSCRKEAGQYMPTPEEIRLECEKIRAERVVKRDGETVRMPIVHRYVRR